MRASPILRTVSTTVLNVCAENPKLKDDVSLINCIPGLGNTTAAEVLAYPGDMQCFKNAKALAGFVGVAPKIKVSGSSERGRSVIARSGRASRDVNAGHGCVEIQPADESLC